MKVYSQKYLIEMLNKPNIITLIGMPSAGKTTVGSALAVNLGYDYFDLDMMVEEKEEKSLIDVMDTKGADYFRDIERDILKKIDLTSKVVISPAGSIIFQKEAMDWILNNSFVVFLDTPLQIIEERLKVTPKAVAGLKERGIQSIYDERLPMYKKFSSQIIDTKNKSIEQIVNEIVGNFI